MTNILINHQGPTPQNYTSFAILFADARRSAKKFNKKYWGWMWRHSVLLNEFNVNNRYIDFYIGDRNENNS